MRLLSELSRRAFAVPTLPDLLVLAAERSPDADAVVFPERRATYAQLLEGAEELARGLLARGVERGSKVGVLMANSMEYAEALLGISLVGAIPVLINARYRSTELAHVFEDADLAVVLVNDVAAEHADHVELLRQITGTLRPGTPGMADLVMLGLSCPDGVVPREAFLAAGAQVNPDEVHLARSRVRLRDPAIMMYTSGTTAIPKGCPLSHEALVRTAIQAGRTRFRLDAGDRVFDPLPMFHMSFLLPFIAALDAGASILLMTHFEPGAAIGFIEREQPTIDFSSFPTIVQAILDHPEFDVSKHRSVRLINVVAPPDYLRSLQRNLPHAVQISAYGCTEVGGVCAFGDIDDGDEVRATTSGRPFDGIEVQIRDVETGTVLGVGERGEILVRGYNVFDGYHNDPVKTAECFDAHGWFRTGDIGILDDGGRITYLGRTKDMLKVGGENVAAAEIESRLLTHPAVAIAQVVGVPDARLGEVPVAFVELRPGQQPTDELAAELAEHCRGHLASFKVPRRVLFVDSWPMSATKIQKHRLREQLAAGEGA